MPETRSTVPRAALLVIALGLAVSACSTPGFMQSNEPPPTPSAPDLPSKYAPEDLVGRWGYTSYQNPADRVRTERAARGQCRQPYVINRGPNGGVMMHLADQREQSEQRLKGSPDGKNYIGPPGEPAGGPQDREIISFDGRILVTRYVDPDAAKRYGNMVYVRCAPRA
jgi:hypothetical protein